MRKIIGIAGKARSGKDTIANYLWREYGFTRLAFADPVKLAAQQMFGLSHDQTWEDSYKEVEIPFWGMSPRRMFQLLGTEAGRNVFGHDLWIKRLAYSMSILPADDIVVPDVRFNDEADFIRSQGGLVVHLERPDGKAIEHASHASEAGVERKAEDWTLFNQGTLGDLYSGVDQLMTHLMLK